jgi:hypothetical protein
MSNNKKPAEGSDAETTDSSGTGTVTTSGQVVVVEDEKTFSQEELDEIVAKRLKKQERKLLKDFEAQSAQTKVAKPDPKTATPAPEAPNYVTREEFEKERADRQFAEALAGVPGADKLTAKQRRVLRHEFDPENPGDLVTDAKELFGVAANSQQEFPAKGDSSPPEGVVSQYVAPGAPSAAPREITVNALEWSRDDISRMQADGSFLERVEQWRQQFEGGGETLFRKRIPKG